MTLRVRQLPAQLGATYGKLDEFKVMDTANWIDGEKWPHSNAAKWAHDLQVNIESAVTLHFR